MNFFSLASSLVSFTTPWLLLALLGLPLLWYLLRATPPAPRLQLFPPLALLRDLIAREETPARTPWWLLALRLMIASLLIVGLAGPFIDREGQLQGSGQNLLVVVDDGWTAGTGWDQRMDQLRNRLALARAQASEVYLLTTAHDETGADPALEGPMSAEAALARLSTLTPKPWPGDYATALSQVLDTLSPPFQTLVSSDPTLGASKEAEALWDAVARRGNASWIGWDGLHPVVLHRPDATSQGWVLDFDRPGGGAAETVTLGVLAQDGRLLGLAEAPLAQGDTQGQATLELPLDLRNQIARAEVLGRSNAGAVYLIDSLWQRHRVGLIEDRRPDRDQPLLSYIYYLEQAMAPFAEVGTDALASLMEQDQAVLVLADGGALSDEERKVLTPWIENGGILLRFAGAELGAQPDDLLPVTLRLGERRLGGTMTWTTAMGLAPFDSASPFAGLDPSQEVAIYRQVLAEPTPDLADHTWARLSDGTPLITAAPRGNGWVVLVHTTANADWSNLPLSGLFVEMLRRLLSLSEGVVGSASSEVLSPLQSLNGLGVLARPPLAATGLHFPLEAELVASPQSPPGLYGEAEATRALNLSDTALTLQTVTPPAALRQASFERQVETSLGPWLILAALMLGLVDLVLSLMLRGLLTPGRSLHMRGSNRRNVVASLLLGLLFGVLLVPGTGRAQADDLDEALALEATATTRIAYIETGNPSIDNVVAAGLASLARTLIRRTAVEAGPPQPVVPGVDELAFYPLIYWPVSPELGTLSAPAREAVNSYLAHGGTILFDLRDPAGLGGLSDTPSSRALQRLTEGLNIPALAPVPPDHVLTKSFYLLTNFPGRFPASTLWLDTVSNEVNDGVASVLIGSGDWAGAWATNSFGRHILPVAPDGERQRELAYRFGINLMVYALTGNYKADQVHVPFILERLGQ